MNQCSACVVTGSSQGQGIRRNCPFLVDDSGYARSAPAEGATGPTVPANASPGEAGDPIDRSPSAHRYAEAETAEPWPLDPAEAEELESVANELPGRSGAIRRFTAAAAIAVSGALLIAGCAAGQDTQTTNQRPPIDGASTDAGSISIRTAAVAASDTGDSYAKGSDAKLQLVIINNGPQQVQLQSVSSPVAGSAQVSSTGVNETTSSGLTSSATESASPAASGSATPSGTAGAVTTANARSSSPATTGSATASATASASETPSPSESASTPANAPISIPAGGSVQVGFSPVGPNVILSGLTAELYPAQTVPVTFTFSDGTTVTLDVPVALPSSAASAPVVSDATEPTEPNN
jgi:copper(I)-binding protein